MIRHRILFFLGVSLLSTTIYAQVPDVTPSCVYGCGSSSSNSSVHHMTKKEREMHSEKIHFYNQYKRYHDGFMHEVNQLLGEARKSAKAGRFSEAFSSLQQANSTLAKDRNNSTLYKPSDFIYIPQREFDHIDNQREAHQYKVSQEIAAVTAAQNNQLARNQQRAVQQQPAQQQQLAQKPGAAHPRIGAAATVRGDVYWLTSDGQKVPINNGTPILLNEHVYSGANGHMQVMLLDETVFTIGPDSDMVLDNFVYDPNTTTGKIAANVVKGTFRFVTGKMHSTDPDARKLKLTVGTIGIRGTDFEVQFQPGAPGYIKLFRGELEITPANAGAVFAMHGGQMVVIGPDEGFGAPGPLANAAAGANDAQGNVVTNNNGTTMQQLQSADCVAQNSPGNWGACGLPASVISSQEAVSYMVKWKDRRGKKELEYNQIGNRMQQIKSDMADNKGDVRMLDNRYSGLSSRQEQIKSDMDDMDDQMNGFIVHYVEFESAKAKPASDGTQAKPASNSAQAKPEK